MSLHLGDNLQRLIVLFAAFTVLVLFVSLVMMTKQHLAD